MFYHNITSDDMLNGDGLRVVLWVSGCAHACKNCQNPSTWCANSGIPFSEWDEAEFWDKLAQKHIDGCTFSGGDPLYESNREKIAEMIYTAKKLHPEKDIWLYTGYNLSYNESTTEWEFSDEVKGLEPFTFPALSLVDVIVDGRFEQSVRDHDIYEGTAVHWRGSSNQRIIDVKESLVAKQVVLLEE